MAHRLGMKKIKSEMEDLCLRYTDPDGYNEVLDRIIEVVNNHLSNVKLSIELTKKAKDTIIDKSYTKEFGARPIKRYVTKNIETLIAEGLLNETIHEGDNLVIDYNNEFIIKTQ